METWKEEQVKAMADGIRDKLSGGRVLGEPVDFDNQDMMIVAVYYLARDEGATRHIATLELEEGMPTF